MEIMNEVIEAQEGKQRTYFPFYASFLKAINTMPTDADKLRWFYAIANYALNGIEPQFEGPELTSWELLKPNLDSSKRHYENGCKGGCPKGTRKESMDGNQNASKGRNSQNKTKTKPIKENGYSEVNKDKGKWTNEQRYIRSSNNNNIAAPPSLGGGAAAIIINGTDKAPKLPI